MADHNNIVKRKQKCITLERNRWNFEEIIKLNGADRFRVRIYFILLKDILGENMKMRGKQRYKPESQTFLDQGLAKP